MANIAVSEYRVLGLREPVENLWSALQTLGVNGKDVYLCDLAKMYGIDYEKKHLCVRGYISWAEFDDCGGDELCQLSFDTSTAWSACTEFIEELNNVLGGELSISYREVEPGCDVFFVHDEGDYFPEECCVSSAGEPFDDAFEDNYMTIADAIDFWCEKMNIGRDGRTDEDMMDFINDYEYEDADTYFYIHPYVFG